MIEILYKSKNVVVINKPQGMPSAPDTSRDLDAMTATAGELESLGECSTLFLVHRLDRGTGGVLMLARNKEAAKSLSELVREHLMVKEYLSVVEGTFSDCEMRDYIYKDSIRSRAVITSSEVKGAKPCRLYAESLQTVSTAKGERTLAKITLYTGRFHQIRAQMSSRGLFLVGDGKYGSKDKRAHMPALYSAHLSLSLGNEDIDCVALPDSTAYPWSLFDLSKI